MLRRFETLLLKTQTYTKTDMRYLLRGGFWVLSSYVVQVSTGIITTIALANLLPKEALGTYQFVLSIAAIISVLTLSGLGTSITKAVAQGNDGALRSGVRIKLRWGISIVLISGLVALYYYANNNLTLALSFLVVGAFAPLIESFKLYINFLHGKEAFRDNLLLGAWRKPLPLVALVATVFFTDDVLTLIFVYFVSNTLSYLAVYYSVIAKYHPPLSAESGILALGKHLSVLRIVGTIGANIDKILIWHFLGSAAVASFSIAQLATRYSGGLISATQTLVLPKVAKRDLPTLQKTLPHKVHLFSIVMGAGAVLYVFVAPLIIPILFPAYPESVMLSQWLALGLVFVPRSVYEKVLIAHEQIKAQYILTLSTTVTKVLLLYILLPLYGIYGAVIGLLLTDLGAALLVHYFFVTAKVSSPDVKRPVTLDHDAADHNIR